jgi:hypothetical protein
MSDPASVLESARRELARLCPTLDLWLGDLDAGGWRARPRAEEWAPVEIVCHLRDEETEDFGARLRVVLAGGSAFAPIDPARWAEARRYRDAEGAAALADLRARRAGTLRWLATIAPERLRGAVDHPGVGPLTGLDFLVAWVTHDRLHLAQLASTLARLWADGWAPLRADYAGPLPYGTPGA